MVLLVEDDPATSEMMETVLAMMLGVGPVLAPDGQEAIRKARELKPDLILLDIVLPELDGLEVARRLKADPATAATPVIAVSVLGDERRDALAAGCDDYIEKPFELDYFVHKVEKYLLKEREAA
jgi:CheY-like chemotaxis protein